MNSLKFSAHRSAPRILRSVFFYSTLIILVLFFSSTALAQECTCPAKPEIVDALRDSSVAFVGRAEKVKHSPLRKGYEEIKFKVFKRYKFNTELADEEPLVQTQQNFTFIYTPTEKASCSFNFREGYDYLVYASGTPAFLKTDSCTRTSVLDYVLNEVKTIENLLKKVQSEESKSDFEKKSLKKIPPKKKSPTFMIPKSSRFFN